MNTAYVWIKKHSELKSRVLSAFETDGRRSSEASISDAIASSPALLPEIMKSLTYEALKQDATDETVDELLNLTRKMNNGVKRLAANQLDVIKGLRGVQTAEQASEILKTAAAQADDESSRKMFERAAESVQHRGGADTTLTAARMSKPKQCLLCCGIGGLIAELPGCVVGCVVCTLESDSPTQ